MSVACQGLGASVWYPCKDHQSDEPEDGANLHITVPDSLQGHRQRSLARHLEQRRWHQHMEMAGEEPDQHLQPRPVHRQVHPLERGVPRQGWAAPCDYWVLAGNEAKARDQFKQVPEMLNCFEEWLGPYPFYQDGYKLVEAPHLGMEHQSAIAYGNNYVNGYRGAT
jgi:hypothetical protein